MKHQLSKVHEFRLKLYPKDFAKSRQFYGEILGFEQFHSWDRGTNDQGAMFRVGNTTLELLTPEGEHQPYAGTGLSLEVEDVTALYRKLKDACALEHELRHNQWGDTSFGIYDPEGLQISFFTKND